LTGSEQNTTTTIEEHPYESIVSTNLNEDDLPPHAKKAKGKAPRRNIVSKPSEVGKKKGQSLWKQGAAQQKISLQFPEVVPNSATKQQ
jgi:hypothetical protein